MDNPEKPSTQGTEHEEKQNKDTTQYASDDENIMTKRTSKFVV
jgi:hypothetical protein